MKKYNSFPYNESQRRLHLTEDRYLQNINSIVKHFAHTKKEKEKLRKELFRRMNKIKKQNPHPAEILSDFQGCFWDRDLYWMHWDFDKHLIIPRMLVTELEESIKVLERFYKKETILEVLKETREHMGDDTFEFIGNYYDIDFPRPVHTKPPFWEEKQNELKWTV